MNMNRDEGFKLCPFNLCKFLSCLLDQHVQQIQKNCVSLLHNFLVVLGVCQSIGGISGPYHLDSQQADLEEN